MIFDEKIDYAKEAGCVYSELKTYKSGVNKKYLDLYAEDKVLDDIEELEK